MVPDTASMGLTPFQARVFRAPVLVLVPLLASLMLLGCSDSEEENACPGCGVSPDGSVDGTVGPDGTVVPEGSVPEAGTDSPADAPSPDAPVDPTDFTRPWVHVGETSALIYWQRQNIADHATSFVEYGDSATYGQTTAPSAESRWAHLHRITGLTPATSYHFRMVMNDGSGDIVSEDGTFTTENFTSAIRIPADVSGPPYVLDQDDGFYVLTEDVTAQGTAIEVTGANVVLELDGHTVTFATSSSEQVRGVIVEGSGQAVVQNGHVVQGGSGGDYSVGVETRWRAEPIEIFGITTDVSSPNAYPMRLFGSAQDAEIHHNHLYSTVTEIESRHYPGNHLLRVDGSGDNISVHDNILTEGAHRGLSVGGNDAGSNIEVSYNDIRHHARFVNGYAISGGGPNGGDFHHNRVTSTGRGVHLTQPNTEFHDNWLDTRGHMTLDDMPQGSGVWTERMVELHGIKFEGAGVTNTRVYGNTMRIIQTLPDADWEYVPATPLNIACYNPNAMNEVFDNTFIALTEYDTPRHGGYGDSGQWAAGIYFVGMDHGAATGGNYSISIHDNEFFTNDLYAGAGAEPNMTILVENNTFNLVSDPPPTNRTERYRGLSPALQSSIESDNTFQ